MMQFRWEFPYASLRMPVMAGNVVATSQPLSTQAGIRMLLKGGNAVDAALAAAITLTVVEPTGCGVGSDAFAIVWDGAMLHGLNASGKSPAAWNHARFSRYTEMPLFGWDSVTVPGAVSAWVALSDKFGRLPFSDLFEPAISYARDGFPVSPIIADAWRLAAPVYRDYPGFGAAFLPGGRSPETGETFRHPELARTLELIAETRGKAFYEGELAGRIAAHAKESGGAMTADDLAGHRAEWVEPISIGYRNITIHELPPNGQGIAALLMLGILDNLDIASYPPDSVESLHIQIEAMKLAFADTYRYVADPSVMEIHFRNLLDPNYLSERARLINPKKAGNFHHGLPSAGDTVYLSAADSGGMMVSFIQSNYLGFGSGIVIPGTGISMQNRGACFTLKKGHPNELGGNKRPFHTIIPAFATCEGKPVMSFGVMGGPMQPQGHGQIVVRMTDYHQNPQAASDALRWQVFGGLEVAFESGFSPDVLHALRTMGHMVISSDRGIFGGAQIVCTVPGGYCAASDSRKDGQAAGY